MSKSAVNTTCAYCGVGCGVEVGESDNRHIRVRGDKTHPANFGKLCVKGTHLGDVLPLKQRLLTPMVNGAETGWDEATDLIATKISTAIEAHGPDSFAFYLSGQLLTEDYYAANKLAKGFIGTANVDTNSRLCMSSAVAAHVRAFGEDAPPISFEDIEEAELLVLTGSNLAWAHPILFQRRLKAQLKDPNKKLVVIDPRKTASAKEADLHLAVEPGSDGQLFNALLVYLADNNGCDHPYIQAHVENFEETLAAARADVGSYLSEQAEKCGLSEEAMLAFFKMFANTPKTVTVWSMGINQSESGVDKGNALINVHLATGRIGKPGSNAFSVTGQPNAMGGREVGGLANQLAVHRGFDKQSVKEVGEFWQAENMATQPGLKAIDLIDACLKGKIKVLWIMATNPLASLPDANRVRKALQKVETVIVSDVTLQTDTLAYADIALPALAWGEKDGMVTNTDRTISHQRAFLLPPGKAQADWWAIAQVARKLGCGYAFNWQTPHEIFREHARLSCINSDTPLKFDLSEISELSANEYQAWQPKQWPLDGKTDASRLFSDGNFATENGKARMLPVNPVRPPARKSSELFLNTGRLRDQWHTMARTGLASTLNRHTNQFEVHFHPEDASEHGIKNGDLVSIHSAEGSFMALTRIETAQRRGEIFAPMHWNAQFASEGGVGNCIAPVVDPISGQPASKHSRVTIRKYPTRHTGFVFVKGEDETPEWLKDHVWFRSYTEQGTLYRFFSSQSMQRVVKAHKSLEVDYMLQDSASESSQWARFDSKGLSYWLTAGVRSINWPEVNFLDDACSAAPESLSLNALLTGNFDNSEQSGKTICTCFGVTDADIRMFFAENPGADLAAMQAELKAGTNCGSCLTEAKELVMECEAPAEFYKAG